MKLKLDENLGTRGQAHLIAAGHDVTTVAEQGLLSASDQRLITACRDEARCLVTLDRDFANPLRYPPGAHAGVAVLRLPARPNPGDLDDAIRTLLSALAQRQIADKLWIVQRGRIREYRAEPLN